MGVKAVVIDKQTISPKEKTIAADIIISGVGSPGIITSDMVKEGVIIIDAGTSEQGGKLAGDMAPKAEEKASFFTPVPGGVGPVTVAVLFENLVYLS
ncbi:MAG: bifunctional methylenetetrahydrofolate dehydrogenase/methenyltetrahydrofolate cyclohydrolase, partial [bacterium]|nr:bifunctional methylenetetrahydrofolate dehydrogenase/methenyltetrahydrofolate cyclohydrolase [bacterium]